MSTTAVSFRKGNTQENEEFAGVAGEIVADLGTGQSSDENATIILHTGDSVLGGIRMARKDCKNLEWSDAKLSELSGTTVREGFVWNDLGNLSQNAPVNQEEVSGYLQNNFNLTSTDGKNLDTYYITGEYNNWTGGGTRVATIKLNNIDNDGRDIIKNVSYDNWKVVVDTEYLTSAYSSTGKTGGPLAYKDMSNVNTLSLAGTGPTATGKTAQGTALAYNDLSNVDNPIIVNKVNSAYPTYKLSSYEEVSNKTDEINSNNQASYLYYPTINAVVTHVKSETDKKANRELDNINSWDVASRKEQSYIYEVEHISGNATGFNLSNVITDNAQWYNSEMTGHHLIIIPQSIDSYGVMTAKIQTPSNGYFKNSPEYDNNPSGTQLTDFYYNYGSEVLQFRLKSRKVVPGKLMLADFDNSDMESYNRSYIGYVRYDLQRNVSDDTQIDKISNLEGHLFDNNTKTFSNFGAKTTNNNGVVAILSSNHYSGTIDSPTTDKYSSIVVSKESAYLNKNIVDETVEALDTNHELLNRSEIVTYVGDEIASAIQQVISTAVVFKGIVANETLLPSSNQVNGDLYWITAFSSNPPSGMIEGRSGSAIWVQPSGSVGSWSYEMDSQNVPDGVTLKYTTTATSQVLSVKLSGAQNGVANAIQSTSDGLYVKTPTYLPALPQADGVYHLYVDNGTYTWINDARLVVTGS